MTDLQNKLISKAKAKYGKIYPCTGKESLFDCITHEEKLGLMMLWFNTEADRSTRVLTLTTSGKAGH